jgi:hypothetical protein
MQDVAFLVRLPERATGIQRSRRLWDWLSPEDEIQNKKNRQGKDIQRLAG